LWENAIQCKKSELERNTWWMVKENTAIVDLVYYIQVVSQIHMEWKCYIGSVSFVVTASDLHPVTPGNSMTKYADDTWLPYRACVW
jgi:hypothetical protein